MIIFYNKETGKIAGNIEGRVHNESHMKMWIGDEETNGRLVYDWEKTEDGWKPKVTGEEADIVISLDKRETRLKDYKVDLGTKRIVKQ